MSGKVKKVLKKTRKVIGIVLAAAGIFVVVLIAFLINRKERTAKIYEITNFQVNELITSDFEIQELVGESTDYSNASNWLCISNPIHQVDTFYIYPTIISTDKAEDIIPVTDPIMRMGAGATLVKNAKAFSDSTNVFAPFYRQSNLNALAPLRGAEVEKFQMQEQRTDIYGALDYYFEHYNNGRPFILAGHSQGSIMVKIVLEEYMQAHPDLYARMVAAYVIGYSVTKDDLEKYPHMKFAEGEDDTGVIISWNTEGPKNKNADNIVVLKNAISINPINWKRDDTYAPSSENIGSRISKAGDDSADEGDYQESFPGLADARVDLERGVVIQTNENLRVTDMGKDYDIVGPQSYHKDDYTFYFYNLKENVGKRVQAYLDAHDKNGFSIVELFPKESE